MDSGRGVAQGPTGEPPDSSGIVRQGLSLGRHPYRIGHSVSRPHEHQEGHVRGRVRHVAATGIPPVGSPKGWGHAWVGRVDSVERQCEGGSPCVAPVGAIRMRRMPRGPRLQEALLVRDPRSSREHVLELERDLLHPLAIVDGVGVLEDTELAQRLLPRERPPRPRYRDGPARAAVRSRPVPPTAAGASSTRQSTRKGLSSGAPWSTRRRWTSRTGPTAEGATPSRRPLMTDRARPPGPAGPHVAGQHRVVRDRHSARHSLGPGALGRGRSPPP